VTVFDLISMAGCKSPRSLNATCPNDVLGERPIEANVDHKLDPEEEAAFPTATLAPHRRAGRFDMTPLYDVRSAWPIIGDGPNMIPYASAEARDPKNLRSSRARGSRALTPCALRDRRPLDDLTGSAARCALRPARSPPRSPAKPEAGPQCI
jgi:hypothetical protein